MRVKQNRGLDGLLIILFWICVPAASLGLFLGLGSVLHELTGLPMWASVLLTMSAFLPALLLLAFHELDPEPRWTSIILLFVAAFLTFVWAKVSGVFIKIGGLFKKKEKKGQ